MGWKTTLLTASGRDNLPLSCLVSKFQRRTVPSSAPEQRKGVVGFFSSFSCCCCCFGAPPRPPPFPFFPFFPVGFGAGARAGVMMF